MRNKSLFKDFARAVQVFQALLFFSAVLVHSSAPVFIDILIYDQIRIKLGQPFMQIIWKLSTFIILMLIISTFYKVKSNLTVISFLSTPLSLLFFLLSTYYHQLITSYLSFCKQDAMFLEMVELSLEAAKYSEVGYLHLH